ncbi:hypothetical protein ERHA54_50050 (plasmid) [Erwinia rhapontici]|nr:hypothetical protein ERHA54_50050 [Erwinia rhapontici]
MSAASHQSEKIAVRAGKMLNALTEQIQAQKQELHEDVYFQVYAKAALSKLPKLTRANVDYAVSEMEENGYIFDKRSAGSSTKYAMNIQNIIDIYHHRGVPKYRDRHSEALTVFVGNLKGGYRRPSQPSHWLTVCVLIRIFFLRICVFWLWILTRSLQQRCFLITPEPWAWWRQPPHRQCFRTCPVKSF